MLRPQDLLVCFQLSLFEGEEWKFTDLAEEVGLSASEAHQAVNRLSKAGLVQGRTVKRRELLSFLEHGVRHAFFAQRGAPTRGMPTGFAAPPLSNHMVVSGEAPVWPDSEGKARGYSLKPLYRSVPRVAKRNVRLYELLALTDAIREGGTREREIALGLLSDRILGKDRS
jgi:DNA-binding Lrp family transcriptional regulator